MNNNTTSKNPAQCNPSDADTQPLSIREFLSDSPAGASRGIQLCEKYGVSLDSPWPPEFPMSSAAAAPKPREVTYEEKLAAHNRLIADHMARGLIPGYGPAQSPSPQVPPSNPNPQVPAPTPAESPKSKVPTVLRSRWDESHRAAPNVIFRSALFPALNFQAGRPFVKAEKIYSVDGITVYFTGERFDQSDLDVYLELLHMAASQPLGTELVFSAYTLLVALGRSTGLSDYQWLHSVIIRLCGGTVDMTDHKVRYFGNLLEGGSRNDQTLEYSISINPRFAALFGYGLWSKINREQRLSFGRNMTAKALHAYYSTHAAPGAHSFDTLAGIAKLENKNKRQRNIGIIKAHEAMKEVGFLADFEVIGDTIKVVINQTPSQTRHLVKKATEKTGNPR